MFSNSGVSPEGCATGIRCSPIGTSSRGRAIDSVVVCAAADRCSAKLIPRESVLWLRVFAHDPSHPLLSFGLSVQACDPIPIYFMVSVAPIFSAKTVIVFGHHLRPCCLALDLHLIFGSSILVCLVAQLLVASSSGSTVDIRTYGYPLSRPTLRTRQRNYNFMVG